MADLSDYTPNLLTQRAANFELVASASDVPEASASLREGAIALRESARHPQGSSDHKLGVCRAEGLYYTAYAQWAKAYGWLDVAAVSCKAEAAWSQAGASVGSRAFDTAWSSAKAINNQACASWDAAQAQQRPKRAAQAAATAAGPAVPAVYRYETLTEQCPVYSNPNLDNQKDTLEALLDFEVSRVRTSGDTEWGRVVSPVSGWVRLKVDSKVYAKPLELPTAFGRTVRSK